MYLRENYIGIKTGFYPTSPSEVEELSPHLLSLPLFLHLSCRTPFCKYLVGLRRAQWKGQSIGALWSLGSGDISQWSLRQQPSLSCVD